MTDIHGTFTIGRLYDALKRCVNKDATVYFDFGGVEPSGCDSSRGWYEHLAISFSDGQYSSHLGTRVSALLGWLDEALAGQEFHGWKGGTYRYTRDTPVWVDNRGNWSGTAIVGVDDIEHSVYILTKRQESEYER